MRAVIGRRRIALSKESKIIPTGKSEKGRYKTITSVQKAGCRANVELFLLTGGDEFPS